MCEPETVSITFDNITEEEKSLVHEKTRDEWTYKYVTESGEKTYELILKLVHRGDCRKGGVVVLDGLFQLCVLNIGQEIHYDGQSRGSFALHYSYRILKYDSRPGSIGYDIQALMKDRDEITLVASDGTEFPIGKYIFMARSEVFKAMFEKDTKESRENRVHFENMSPNVLEKLVMFLNTDKVDEMDDNVAYRLGLLCHRYGLHRLFELVEEYFRKNCTENNLDCITELIHLHKSLDLAKTFVAFKRHDIEIASLLGFLRPKQLV